jgi:hypothetical protein
MQEETKCHFNSSSTEAAAQQLESLRRLWNASADDALVAMELTKGADLTEAQMRTLAHSLHSDLQKLFLLYDAGAQGYKQAFAHMYRRRHQYSKMFELMVRDLLFQ